jgi:hypothetical protein
MMCDHVPQCWGKDSMWNEAKDLELDRAKDIIRKFKKMKNVKLTDMLAIPGSKEMYSLSPPSHEEIQLAFQISTLFSSNFRADLTSSVTVAR